MTDSARGKGLLVDYGGVLTSSLAESFRAFERAAGLPKGTIFAIVAEAYREAGGDNPIARFELGGATKAEFEQAMAEHLRERGFEVDPDDLTHRLFDATALAPTMWEVVRHAREAGVRTALLSNSWGTHGYPMERLNAVFDALVISGEVGIRKPDPRIFRLAADRLGVQPADCAFVDDLERNVEAARELGMFGVHHRDAETTARELSGFLGVDLVAAVAAADRSGG